MLRRGGGSRGEGSGGDYGGLDRSRAREALLTLYETFLVGVGRPPSVGVGVGVGAGVGVGVGVGVGLCHSSVGAPTDDSYGGNQAESPPGGGG